MAERSIELDSIELAAAIFGNCDQNVRLLENEFGVTAVCRGSALKFTGEEEGVVLNASGYRFDLDGLHSVYEILNRYPLQVTSWTDTSLSGVVDTEKAGLLFTSIPYDKGWTVKVDGIQRETQKIFDTFLAVEVPDGAHTIEFTYMPQGLLTGAAISGGSVLFLAAAAAVERALRRRREENEMR